MKIFKNNLLIILASVIAGLAGWQSCDLPWQPGPMPDAIIETEFVPGLNILGIVRLEDTTASSFVYIERAYASNEYETWVDSLPIIKNANVWIAGTRDTTGYIFRYYGEQSDHKYINADFRPVAGETYQLTITAPDLPDLSASTSVPHLPTIDTGSVVISDGIVNFNLRTTADAYLYDVYLLCENGQLVNRLSNDGAIVKELQFKLNNNLDAPLAIQVYGYDENMATILNATSSIIPQSFLETLSTVEGGYGCFGAVSVLTYVLP